MTSLAIQKHHTTELLRNAHHAVVGPISSLLNLVEIILAEIDGEISAAVRQDVTDMATDVARLQASCGTLLALCCLDSAPTVCEPLDIRDPIGCAVTEMNQRASGVSQTLYSAIPAALPPIYANADCVYDLMTRLLTYIFHFTDQASLRIAETAQGVLVCLGTGSTLPDPLAEDATALPDHWFQNEHALELLVCQRLVEVQGGTFRLGCPPGAGPLICFSLAFPS